MTRVFLLTKLSKVAAGDYHRCLKAIWQNSQEKRDQQFTAYLFLGNSYSDWKGALGNSSSVQAEMIKHGARNLMFKCFEVAVT